MKIRDYSRIIVEGMDGAGKSKLVSQLIQFLGDNHHYIPGYNRVVGDKPPMPQWWMDQLAYNPKGKVVLHDRFFYPELVYGPVLRNRIAVEPSTRNYVQSYIRANCFVIYCRPPTFVIKKGINVERQMAGVKEHFDELLLKYDQLMMEEAKIMPERFALYDWSEENSLSKLLRRLSGYIYQ